MTYNIRHGRGIDNVVDLSRIQGVLLQYDPDLVFLQEVDAGLPRSSFLRQAEALLGSQYLAQAFHANFGVQRHGMGNAILSKYPIYSTWNKGLPFLGEPRGLLGAEVQTPAGRIATYSTHWGLTQPQRLQQSAFSVSELVHRPGPAIFCGDLNATSNADEVKTLIEHGSLLDCGPNIGRTFTSALPVVKIDYILTTSHFTVLDSKIIHSQASDHFPVIVTLSIPDIN